MRQAVTMADKKMDWTSEQHKAVTHRGRNMLVSASAGTGKTAVLSGRCAEIAKDEKADISVLDMLVLTFTEAAADEMRSRIAGMLRDKYLEAESRRLRRQLILLQGSDISTIHSFCKRLITEYFYKLELDPAFRVIDEDEQKLLKTEVLEETIDWAWEQQGLREAMKDLLRGRDLRTQDGFLEVIVRINGFLDGVVSRENWFLKAEGMTREQDPAAGGLGKVQKDIILKKLRHSLDKLRNCRKIYEEQSGHTEWSEGIEQTHIRPVLQCIEHIENGRWAESEAMIADYKPPRTCKPNDINSTAAESLHALAKDAVDGVKELKRLAVLDPEYKEKTAKAAGVQTAAVIEMAKKFSELYGYAKQEINGLDFADLEHFALRLLTKDVNAAALEPSDTAVLLRKRYKHILVDEYQDVNPVQKAILTCSAAAIMSLQWVT